MKSRQSNAADFLVMRKRIMTLSKINFMEKFSKLPNEDYSG